MASFAEKRIALLIDGDNAQPKLIEAVLEEASKRGLVTIRRIYGDWTKPDMNGWKKVLNSSAIQPIQQFRYTIGKNATDSTLIIDAMDILHAKVIDGFCIVSSDSDYTRLATRIREAGIFVMGIGQKKTPEPFVKACELFIFTENLAKPVAQSKTVTKTTASKASKPARPASKLPSLLKRAFNMVLQEDETAYLGEIGQALRKLDPSFDPRTYGHSSLTRLIQDQTDLFEVISPDESTSVYIKLK